MFNVSTPVHPIIIWFDLFTKCSICQHTIFEIKNYHSWTPYLHSGNWIGLVSRPHGISSRRKDFRASDERYCSSPNLEGQWRVHVDLLKVMPIMIHHFDNKSNWNVHTGDPMTTGPRIVRSLGWSLGQFRINLEKVILVMIRVCFRATLFSMVSFRCQTSKT